MRALVVAALFLSPLAFGSVHRGPLLVLCAVSVAAGLRAWRAAARPAVARLLLVLGALTALQSLPLPRGLLAVLSPGSVRGESAWGTVALSPLASWVALGVVASLGLLHVAAHDFDAAWRERLVTAVIVAGVVASAVGLVQNAAGSKTIYGLYHPQYDWAVYGPFVNRNHFSGYMLLAAPLAAGRVLSTLSRLVEHWRRRRRRRWLALLEPEASRTLSYLGMLIVIVVAVIDSGSRGALLAGVGGALVFACARWRSRLTSGAAVVGVLALAAVLASSERLRGLMFVGRGEMWLDTLRLLPRFPLLGCGLESFAEAYRRIQSVWLLDFVHHAHNEYLQAWIELGPLGLLVTCGTAFVVVRSAWRQGRTAAPLAAALAGVALHNLFDFNWHIPATAATWAALAGFARQAHGPDEPGRARSRSTGTERSEEEAASAPDRPRAEEPTATATASPGSPTGWETERPERTETGSAKPRRRSGSPPRS